MNFLRQDGPDLQYPIKECSRDMAKSNRGAWRRAKRVARYLVYRKTAVWIYEWQEDSGESFTMSDSDWVEILKIASPLLGGGGCWEARNSNMVVHAGSLRA